LKKTLIVCPTYNEAENIGSLMRDLMALEIDPALGSLDLLVVDDTSPDGTADLVARRARQDDRVHLLLRTKKEGLSAAYLAGFRWGMERGYDQFIQMDADFSHRPSDVPRFMKALETADVAIGCRYIEGGGIEGWGLMRNLISRGGNTYARRLLHLPYKDVTGGFNAWRREVLEDISLHSLRSRGYAYQVEMKYRAHRRGARITELPIHFENRRLGQSKMAGWIIWEAAVRVLEMRRGTA
jgi:dolichol-phosphate mannosyltransferase